jgi:hypothetical protein
MKTTRGPKFAPLPLLLETCTKYGFLKRRINNQQYVREAKV